MKKMKVEAILSQGHSLMNETVMNTASELKEAAFIIKLDDALKMRGITQKDLAQMTGMRVGTISEFVNGKGISINKVQLIAMMVALRITDVSQIFEIRLPNHLHEEFEQQKSEWIESKEMPIPVKEMYRENILKNTGL